MPHPFVAVGAAEHHPAGAILLEFHGVAAAWADARGAHQVAVPFPFRGIQGLCRPLGQTIGVSPDRVGRVEHADGAMVQAMGAFRIPVVAVRPVEQIIPADGHAYPGLHAAAAERAFTQRNHERLLIVGHDVLLPWPHSPRSISNPLSEISRLDVIPGLPSVAVATPASVAAGVFVLFGKQASAADAVHVVGNVG